MRRGIGASAGILALFALLLRFEAPPAANGRANSTGENSSAHSANASAPESHPVEGPWIASHAFFGTTDWWILPEGDYAIIPSAAPEHHFFLDTVHALLIPGCPGNSHLPPAHQCDQLDYRARVLLGEPPGWTISSIVATVPDPLHTRLPLMADEQIEAIERSASRSGWEFAEQWLPWLDRPGTSQDDINERRAQRKLQREQQELPGVLIFRPTDASAQKRALFVFLVPETPTAGINKVAFHVAMHFALGVSQNKTKAAILGPTFSGSLSSLASLLRGWAPGGTRPGNLSAHIYSGTISSQDGMNRFEAALPKQGGTPIFELRSTVAREDDYQWAVCAVLGVYGIKPEAAAYLTEDETAYGKAGRRAVEARDSNCGKDIRGYVFPRDVAQVRNAYQEAAPPERLPYAQDPPSLNFSIRDPNSGEDSVPIYSEAQTPLSENAMLVSIAEDLRQRRTRLAYVAATNVLDELFLARFLRQECPDMRVVAANPDILFVPAASRDPLSGTLFLSTYPMFPSGDEWLADATDLKAAKDRTHNVLFSSSNGQGVFNALKFLMTATKAEMRTDAPPTRGYGQPGQDYPGLWLLTLSRSGFQPLALFGDGDIPGRRDRAKWFVPGGQNPVLPTAVSPPLSWLISTVFVLGATLFLYLLSRKSGTWVRATKNGAAGLTPAVVMCFSLGAALFVLAVPVLFMDWGTSVRSAVGNAQPDSRVHWFVEQFIVTIAAMSAAVLAFIRGVRLAARAWSANIARLHLYCTFTVVLLAGLCADWVYLCSWAGADRYEPFLFRFRALDLYSGASPALPLALLCVCLFGIAWIYMYRFDRAEHARPSLKLRRFTDQRLEPHLDDLNKWRERLDPHYTGVNRWIRAPFDLDWSAWRWRALFRAGLGVACALILQGYPFAFERLGYNAILAIAYTFVLFLLAANCYDMWNTWKELKGVLDAIETSAAIEAIDVVIKRVAARWPRRPIWAIWGEASKELKRELLSGLSRAMEYAKENPGIFRVFTDAAGKSSQNRVRQIQSDMKKMKGAPEGSQKFETAAARIAYDRLSEIVILRGGHIGQEDWKPGQPRVEQVSHRYIELCAEFFILVLVRFIVYAVSQIRQMALALSFGFVLLLVLFNSYNPRGPMMMARFLAVSMVAIGCVVVWVFQQMERNPLLSAIAQTDAGELNKEFYWQMIQLGALPLLGVVAHLFPQIAQFLGAWVAPSVEQLH